MDSIFFWLSKTLWAVASPGGLPVLAAVALWLFIKAGAQRAARCLSGLSAAALLFIAAFPVGEWMLYPLEANFTDEAPATVDGIIVLGGTVDPVKSAAWNRVEAGATAEREFNFLALARRYPRARLAFTGGSGSLLNQQHKEAGWTAQLFEQQGIELSRVTFESQSRNTYENAVFSKRLLDPVRDERWLLITTAWHMPRAVGAFCTAGFPVTAWPVDHWTHRDNLLRMEWDFAGNLSELNVAVHEWLGLLVYRLTGKTNSLLPTDC